MGSVISTSRVRSPTCETLPFPYAVVNIISHQPTHMLMICMSNWAKVMLKPILLIEIDGTQDEAPWYSKPLAVIVFLLHGVNESHLSEFNLEERSMAPLSHETAEVLLRHYSFENHLDSSWKTADCELEKNFLKTGWVPAEVWPKTDDCKVDAKPLPIRKMYVLRTVDASWGKKHVQQSQYSIQIIKCTDSNYCKKLQTN